MSAIDCGCVVDWLDVRSHLSHRLDRAIELAAIEIPSADHGLNLPGSVLDRDQRTLDERCLLESHDRRARLVVEFSDLHLDDIARFEQVCCGRASGPGKPFSPEVG